MTSVTPLLELQNLDIYYGAIHAVKGISIHVDEGEIVTLIGSNGAGKSTILKCISGLIRPRSGRIRYAGNDITQLAPERIVQLGLCHVPEGRRIFANLSVRENLELGAYTVCDRLKVRESMDEVLATFPRLEERLNQYSGTLSGGEQQMLAIGRALMSSPRLLILDEPSLGLAPFLVAEIFNIIKKINQQGATIMLVEQNAHMALGIATRGYVIETGSLVLSDTSENLANNNAVRKAYLGE